MDKKTLMLSAMMGLANPLFLEAGNQKIADGVTATKTEIVDLLDINSLTGFEVDEFIQKRNSDSLSIKMKKVASEKNQFKKLNTKQSQVKNEIDDNVLGDEISEAMMTQIKWLQMLLLISSGTALAFVLKYFVQKRDYNYQCLVNKELLKSKNKTSEALCLDDNKLKKDFQSKYNGLKEEYLGFKSKNDNLERVNNDLTKKNINLKFKNNNLEHTNIGLVRKNDDLTAECLSLRLEKEEILTKAGINNLKKKLQKDFASRHKSLKGNTAKKIAKTLKMVEEQKSELISMLESLDLLKNPESIPLVFDSADILKMENLIMEVITSFELQEDGSLLVENPIFVHAERLYQEYKKEQGNKNYLQSLRLVTGAFYVFESAKVFEKYVLENVAEDRDFSEDLTEYQRAVVNELRQSQLGNWLTDEDVLKNFYETLRLEDLESNLKIIKTAYRELAKKYHPDKQETGDEVLFVAIQLAYEVLTESSDKYERVFKKYNNIS